MCWTRLPWKGKVYIFVPCRVFKVCEIVDDREWISSLLIALGSLKAWMDRWGSATVKGFYTEHSPEIYVTWWKSSKAYNWWKCFRQHIHPSQKGMAVSYNRKLLEKISVLLFDFRLDKQVSVKLPCTRCIYLMWCLCRLTPDWNFMVPCVERSQPTVMWRYFMSQTHLLAPQSSEKENVRTTLTWMVSPLNNGFQKIWNSNK